MGKRKGAERRKSPLGPGEKSQASTGERAEPSPAQVTQVADIAAAIVDEMQGPLQAIENISAAILLELAGDADYAKLSEWVFQINSLSERIRDGSRSLQDLARAIPAGREPVSLTTLVGAAVERAKSHLEVSQVKVLTELAPSLANVRVAAKQTEKLLFDVLGIAAQCLAELPIAQRTIRIAAELDAHRARIGFHYSGALERTLARLFSTADESPGEGIAVRAAILHGHGGQLWAESDIPDKTVVYVALPLG